MFSTTRRVELPLTEVQKAADKAYFGLEIDQEFVLDQFWRFLLRTEMEILNTQLDIVSGVPKATSRFIDSLGRLNQTQLWFTTMI